MHTRNKNNKIFNIYTKLGFSGKDSELLTKKASYLIYQSIGGLKARMTE